MPRQPSAMTPLVQIIRDEIANCGVLPFERFMELALYCPEYGYYEQQPDTVGRRGDFITSVSTGELFGQLLAWQFADWLLETRCAQEGCQIIEAGAHDGTLARDVLTWLQSHRPDLFTQIRYGILEPSTRRQAWQRENLAPFATQVRWYSGFDDPALRPFTGILFGNELLDAFPVHRHGWDAKSKRWFDWGVGLEADRFVWARTRDSDFSIQNPDLESALPDQYTVETSPAAERWWRLAAVRLKRGRLVAIDYGFAQNEQFSPARMHGTLRGYFRQHPADDVLANAGQQDLTAHVNFPAIQVAGEEAGLVTERFCTQPQFLTRILDKATRDNSLGEWNARRTRQFQTLTHPEHLGRAFHVLVQVRCSS